MISRPVSLALAAGLTRAAMSALRAKSPGGPDRWERENHAGRTVELYAGPATTAGAALAAARVHPAAGFAVVVAGACGAYDDVVGAEDTRRGFRAHLCALRDGEVTSGAVKLFGISAAGLVAGALLKERLVDKVLAGVVIAGAAHFVNLVDVRPGRAAGVVVALGVPGMVRKGPGGALAAAAVGAAAAVLPDDLGERAMLGDTGAHALGAALGAAVVAGNGRAGLMAHAAAVVAAAVHGDTVSEVARSLSLGALRVAPDSSE
jgi:UDP-N-acetylmuramyl pentapeptide phosphotransferase/UDP-N-acetylglucosamine-1-phosphate transferase